ncbi:hypothetical protein V2H45_07800 [Tumidithrix elongata RA019]|uniref:FecR protein domain-containing protein n=1 Tax=Tumidithrix elongata BACA0141 TaxID=2716417 RepID=A0AAW9PXM7_9CYAN|nr:hypothetical protein [Tumidithrix elongata RA019]
MKKILLLSCILLTASCNSDVPSPNSSQGNTSSPIATIASHSSTTPSTTPSTSSSSAGMSTNTPNGNIQSAKVTEILDGQQVFIRDRQAAIDDIAKSQEQVRTGESRAELLFNNDAIARLSKNSLLTIGQCGAQLQRGSVLIDGAVPTCTSSMVAAVHGTTYILEADEQGNDQIQVLEGEVEVTRKDEPQAQIQVVRGGERFRVLRQQKRAELQKISQTEYETLLNSPLVKDHKRELPGREKMKAKFQQLFPNAKPVLERKKDLRNDLKHPEIQRR